jgi:hypothetical protein
MPSRFLVGSAAVNCSSTSRSRRVSGSRPENAASQSAMARILRLPARVSLDRLIESRHDFAAAKRLLDEVQRAVLDGADRHGDIALPRDHEDRRRIILTMKLFENIETGLTGDMHIEQDAGMASAFAQSPAMQRRRRNR